MNLLLVTFVAISLSVQKENKEKKQLHNSAVTAFSHQDYLSAKKAYSELLKKMESPENDWQTFVDVIMRSAEVNLFLKEYKEGMNLLLNLLKQTPPAEFLPKITVLLARLYSFQEEAGIGYRHMRQAALTIPLEKWKPEERSFFHAVEYSLNAYYENLLQKARHFTLVSAYKEAICAYDEVTTGIQLGHFPSAHAHLLIEKKVKFRLAECRFLLANFEKTQALVHSTESSDALDGKMLFLATLCYKEKREYEKALLCFQHDLISHDHALLIQYDNALFEMGQFYYRNGNKNTAKEYFEKLLERKDPIKRSALMGLLCLGKIYMEEKKILEAETLFSFIQKHLQDNDPLYFEVTFLQGEAAFHRKDYQKAVPLFEKSLMPTHSKGDWAKRAFCKLGLSYIRQKDAVSIKKGEEILENLLQHAYEEEIALALADFYSSQNMHSKWEELWQKVHSTFSESTKQKFALLSPLTPSCEKTSFSHKASDDYFKCFSIEQYLQGDEKALSHIRAFPALFPQSPLLALSYFLIGHHEKSYPTARAALKKALACFHQVPKDILSEQYHYRTMLELALLDIHYAQDLSFALDLLHTLVSELDNASLLKEHTSYPSLYEESEFALFQTYCLLKKDSLAYKVLLSMLKHYSEAGIKEGFYLSEAWKHQGLFAWKVKDFSTAKICFEIALECGQKYLNSEQKCELILHHSNCDHTHPYQS